MKSEKQSLYIEDNVVSSGDQAYVKAPNALFAFADWVGSRKSRFPNYDQATVITRSVKLRLFFVVGT